MVYDRNKHGSQDFLVVLLTDNQVAEPIQYSSFINF